MLAAAGGGAKDYITFADPVVAQICATNWGDGVGITPAQAAAVTNQQFKGTFLNNTSIVSFDEFEYFTGVTQLAEDKDFNGCTNLASVKLPPNITSIGWGCLGLSSLTGTLVIPNTVTSISRGSLDGTTGLTNLVNNTATTEAFFMSSGNGTGILYMKNVNWAFRYITANYKHILIDGDLTFTGVDWLFQNSNVESIRIKGNYTPTNDASMYYRGGNGTIAFVELGGQITNGSLPWDGYASGAIVHLGYNGIAGTPARCRVSDANITKVYVGSGESQAADQAVLNQYLADPDWAQYSSKLDLWYNYNGEYKNWPTIPTA